MYSTVHHSTENYSTVEYSTMECCTLQYSPCTCTVTDRHQQTHGNVTHDIL